MKPDVSPIDSEKVKSLRRATFHFDHCCWSRDDHNQVLAEIDRLRAELSTAREAREIEVADLHKTLGEVRAERDELRKEVREFNEARLRTVQRVDEFKERIASLESERDELRRQLGNRLD